jgi:uncharacterized membrane protein
MLSEQRFGFFGLAAAAGLIAGLRSVSGPAAVCTALERGGMADDADPIVAAAARFAPAVRLLALAEMGADKLPMMPDRIIPPILGGRVFLGAVAAVLLAQAFRRDPVSAALVGGLGAVAGTYLGFRLRMLASDELHLPSQVAGVAEDLAVVGGGQALALQAQRALVRDPSPVPADELAA